MKKGISMKRVMFKAFAPVGLMWVLFFVIGSGQPAVAQTVDLDILNVDPDPTTGPIEIVRGDPVEVEFSVPSEIESSSSDLIRLQRVDNQALVSQEMRGESLSGTVWLGTDSDLAIGELEVIYLHVLASSVQELGRADKTVWVEEGPSDSSAARLAMRLARVARTMRIVNRRLDRIQAAFTPPPDSWVPAIERLLIEIKTEANRSITLADDMERLLGGPIDP